MRARKRLLPSAPCAGFLAAKTQQSAAELQVGTVRDLRIREIVFDREHADRGEPFHDLRVVGEDFAGGGGEAVCVQKLFKMKHLRGFRRAESVARDGLAEESVRGDALYRFGDFAARHSAAVDSGCIQTRQQKFRREHRASGVVDRGELEPRFAEFRGGFEGVQHG